MGRSCVGSVIIKYRFAASPCQAPPEAVKAYAKFTRTEESDQDRSVPEGDSPCADLFKGNILEVNEEFDWRWFMTGCGTVNGTVAKETVLANELCRKNKLGVLFVSTCTSTNTKTNDETGLTEYEYTFEFKPRTWHYGTFPLLSRIGELGS